MKLYERRDLLDIEKNFRVFEAPEGQSPFDFTKYYCIGLNYYYNDDEPDINAIVNWLKNNAKGKWISIGNGGFTHAILIQDEIDFEEIKKDGILHIEMKIFEHRNVLYRIQERVYNKAMTKYKTDVWPIIKTAIDEYCDMHGEDEKRQVQCYFVVIDGGVLGTKDVTFSRRREV